MRTPEPRPFPSEWLKRFTIEQLERLAIMTESGEMTDEQALWEMKRQEAER